MVQGGMVGKQDSKVLIGNPHDLVLAPLVASKALALAAVAIWQRAHLGNSAESGQALVTCSIGLGPTDFRTSYFIP